MGGRTIRRVGLSTMIAWGLLLSSPAPAAALQILTPSDVTIIENKDCALIRVAFTFPVRYVSHFPYTSGDNLRIHFEPVAISPADREALFTRRSVRPPRTETASLTEVVYEGNVPGGPFLTLLFARARTFRVEQGRDFRSLIVIVSGETAAGECPRLPDGSSSRRFPLPTSPPPERTTAEQPAAGPPPERATAEKPAAAPASVSEEALAQLMEEAAKAVTRGDHRQAVEYYTKVLEYSPHRFSQEAQELLGLARERSGQLAHARTEYEKYLKMYPEGEGADRVRQRLAGLLTARAAPQEKLREAKGPPAATEIHGSFSQFYHRFENYTDQGGNVVTQSLLATDLDLTIRHRTAVLQLSSVFSGGYDHDFLNSDPSNVRVSRFYLDALDRHRGISARVGRQTRSSDGVLGRFDGAALSYRLLEPMKVNALFGFPADPSLMKEYKTDKYFYGLGLDLGAFAQRWNFNLYGIRQEAEGILDREAVGGEARYVDATLSLFSLVDYDISYRELNTILAVANWIFPDQTTLNLAFDQRKSPTLTTSNALIGQPVDSLAALRRTLSENEVRDLARDRTPTSRSLTLGMTHPLNTKLQVSGTLTASELTGTRASGGVDATPGTGYEYFFSAQLIGNSLIAAGDIAILGLRYSTARSADTIGLDLNTRFPLNRDWRINPKVQAEYRQRHPDGTEEVRIRPSLLMDYYLMQRVRLEVEGGVGWTPRWLSNTTETQEYFLTAGYRTDF